MSVASLYRPLLALLLSLHLACSGQATTGPRELEIPFENDGLRIAATLHLPAGKGPFQLLIWTHGSGKEHRKLPGVRGFAKEMSEKGLAVLLYDKRGVGESEGKYVETPPLTTPASDVVKAAETALATGLIDKNRVAVFGHSQGAWIGPLAAKTSPLITHVAALCGGAISLQEQIIWRDRRVIQEKGLVKGDLEDFTSFQRQLTAYMATAEGYEQLLPDFSEATKKPWFQHFRDQGFGTTLIEPQRVKGNPAAQGFVNAAYNPAKDLSDLKIPLFVALGLKDEQVPSAMCAEIYRKVVGPNLTLKELPEEGHPLWLVERNPDGSPKPSMRRGYYSALVDWLVKEGFLTSPS